MNKNMTPSATEFEGYYNSPVIPNICTRHSLPPLTLAEVKEIAGDAYTIIARYANQHVFTSEESKCYYSGCISEQITDRTLNISFINPEDCTFKLIKELQQYLFNYRPLWRVRIGGVNLETTVLIYPDAVRYGSAGHLEKDEMTLFNAILQLESSLRGDSRIHAEKQYQTLRQILSKIMAEVSADSVVVVAEFDNYHGDSSQATLWILCGQAISDVELISADHYMVGDKFRVKSNGDFGYHVNNDAPYWIQQWIFSYNEVPDRLHLRVYNSEYIASEKVIYIQS